MQQISIWEEESFYARQDIVIVGAGFTGLWTALHLKQKFPDRKILIIERDVVPGGASGRNAGFACFGSLTEIAADIKNMGAHKALQLVNLRYLGLKIIQQYFPENLIDYNNCGGYELLSNESPLAALENINKLLYDITGATETFSLKNELIESFGFFNTSFLIENKRESALHSGKLLNALTRLAGSAGVQILYATELKHFEESSSGVVLHTNHEQLLKTEQLVFCTNAFTKKLFPDIDITPARGQVLLTEPIKDLKISGCFHYDEGFYYFRNFNDCILLGGARNASFETEYTFDAFTTLPIQQQLERFLTTVILPGQKPAITHRWAGIMGMGSHKFPVIEQMTDRSYCAVRFAGMGVALAPMAGKMIAEMIN